MTRLLKTAIIGPSETIVDSSWIDMLAGLSPWGILRMPPDFCATAAPDASASTASIAAQPHRIVLLDDLMAAPAMRFGHYPSPPSIACLDTTLIRFSTVTSCTPGSASRPSARRDRCRTGDR